MGDHATRSTANGLFSRRPSIFGGKHPKTPSSTTPPTLSLSLPPVDDDAPLPIASQYEKAPATPPKRRSIASSVTIARSASLRTNSTSSSHRRTPSSTLALSHSPETASNAPARPALSISTFARSKAKSTENVKPEGSAQVYEKSPLSAVDRPKTPFGHGMTAPMSSRHPPSQKEILQQNRQANAQLAPAAPIQVPIGANPNIIFQHIHELASKRISTLDYLRKACVLLSSQLASY